MPQAAALGAHPGILARTMRELPTPNCFTGLGNQTDANHPDPALPATKHAAARADR